MGQKEYIITTKFGKIGIGRMVNRIKLYHFSNITKFFDAFF